MQHNTLVAAAVLSLLLLTTPATAQWTIEESTDVHIFTDRPEVTIASLVSEEGRLAWEYSCLYLGRGFVEDLQLFPLKANQECCDTFKSGSIRYNIDQEPLQRRGWNSGGSWMAPHTPQTMRQFLDGLRKHNALTVQKVGRAGLPTTTLGLLFHAAEHSTRHAGQAISTAKILAGS